MSLRCKQGRPWAWWLVLTWLCAGASFSPAQTNATPKSAPRLPSIVLIVADGLGYGDLGCYGQEQIRTPRIDKLATNSFRFVNFHAGAAEDRLARAALLTGVVSEAGSSLTVPTLAERLKVAGYHTGYIGYWGLGGFGSKDAAHQRGFEETAVYGDRAHAYDLYTDHLFREDPHTGFKGQVPLVENRGQQKRVYLPDLLTRAAVQFCKENKPERLNHYRPFLLVLGYPVPAAVPTGGAPIAEASEYAGKNWPEGQKAKAEAISLFDHHIGEILDELDRGGMAENTIVLVTSSLGPARKPSADSGYFKRTGRYRSEGGELSEGRLRVPLIVSWPFWVRSGKSSNLLAAGQDIVPTLLEAARLDPTNGLEGISFLPTLEGRQQTNQHAWLEWSVANGTGTAEQAVRQGRWKLMERGGGQPPELYDLADDPAEERNVAEQTPEVVTHLKGLLGEADRGSPAPN